MATHFAPSAECLACRVPLEGFAGRLAAVLGAGRSSQNPNLCRRCRTHLQQGQIQPVVLMGVRLEPQLRFGAAAVDNSTLEVQAAVDALRAMVERSGGFIAPADGPVDPCQFEAYFNLPVPAAAPVQSAVDAASLCLEQVRDQEASIGFNLPLHLVLLEGYAEAYRSRDGQACYPHSLRRAELPPLLRQSAPGQVWLEARMLAGLNPGSPVAVAAPQAHHADDLVSLSPQAPSPLRRSLRRGRPRGWPTAAELSALVMALLAAPCAAMMVVSPIALALGLGAFAASVMPLIQAIAGITWLRVALTLLALVLAVGNWIALELSLRYYRALQTSLRQPLRLPPNQRRRALVVRSLAVLVLVLVAVEAILRVVAMKMPLI